MPLWKLGAFAALCAFSAYGAANKRVPLTVLTVQIPDQDSSAREQFARDLGSALAADSLFLVYDARARHAAALDKAFEEGLPGEELRQRVHGGEIALGLFVRCALEENYREEPLLSCVVGALDLKQGGVAGQDSALFVGELLRRRQALQKALLASLRGLVVGKPEPARPKGPALRLQRQAKPARLLRQDAVHARGGLDSIPVGFTVNTGDMPEPALARIEDYILVLYPHSSYSYVLPGVVCLNRGSLGLVRAEDTAGFAAQLKSVTHLDKSNVLWKTVSQLAALDSSNLVWRSLGKIASLDSQSVVGRIRQLASLDSSNPALRAMNKLLALDSGEAVLRALAEVSSLDSSHLIWQGIGRTSSLDSTHAVWKRLAGIPAQSGSHWREIGLLAMQGNIMVLTPSCVLRGRPKTAFIEHEGSRTRVELPEGEIMALPVLSSQQPAALRNLQWGETHGFALERGKLSARRGERLAAVLSGALPRSGGLNLADFLPGRLFARGREVATPSPAVQGYFRGAFGEVGATPDYLLRHPPTDEKSEKGSHASGCYLCRPDRLGP